MQCLSDGLKVHKLRVHIFDLFFQKIFQALCGAHFYKFLYLGDGYVELPEQEDGF